MLKVKLAAKACRFTDGNEAIIASKLESTLGEMLEALNLSMHDWFALVEVFHELLEDATRAVHFDEVIFDLLSCWVVWSKHAVEYASK